jgi:hypothetical protein
LVSQRNVTGARVQWQFTPSAAREKLRRHYQKVHPNN